MRLAQPPGSSGHGPAGSPVEHPDKARRARRAGDQQGRLPSTSGPAWTGSPASYWSCREPLIPWSACNFRAPPRSSPARSSDGSTASAV